MSTIGPGSEFADYVIEEEIGRGGMGVVYRARELHPSRTVALKVLNPDLAGDAAFRQRFLRESDLAAGIGHPNIVPIFDAVEDKGYLFIAMPLIPGRDLGATIRAEGAMPPDRVTRIIEQVGRALDAAHAKGLVHRDIKPGNILLAPGSTPGEYEHVYLADFGLARMRSAETRLTQVQTFLGTLEYAAPEQIRGEDLDGRADIYALGCVLHEMLAGSAPFAAVSESALMYAHLEKEPPSLSLFRPELAEVDAVVNRAMAKRPEDRFASGHDLTSALRSATSRLPAAQGTVLDNPVQATVLGSTLTPPAPTPALPRAAAPRTPVAPPPGTPQPGPPTPPPPGSGGAKTRRTTLLVGAGVLLVLALGAVGAVLASGGSGTTTTPTTVVTAPVTTQTTPPDTVTVNQNEAQIAAFANNLKTFDKQFEAVNAAIPSGKDFGKAKFTLGAVAAGRAINRISDRITRTTPPANVAAETQRMLNLMSDLENDFEDLARASRRKDIDAASTSLASTTQTLAEIRNTKNEILGELGVS